MSAVFVEMVERELADAGIEAAVEIGGESGEKTIQALLGIGVVVSLVEPLSDIVRST